MLAIEKPPTRKSYYDARAEHNRDAVEMWLLTRGQKLSTRPPAHPDEFHGRTGKPGSRPNQDAYWLEAISQPDCVATDDLLRRIVEIRMPLEKPWLHLHIKLVYLGDSSDPAAPGRWQMRDGPGDSIRLLQLEAAMDWIVGEVGNRIIYWPTPEGAKGYVQRNESKKREARYFYIMALESGLKDSRAVSEAAKHAKCTRRAVRAWRYEQEWLDLRPAHIPPPPGLSQGLHPKPDVELDELQKRNG